MVDGRQIPNSEALLSQGSIIYLGQVELKVVAVTLGMFNNSIPPTILMPPLPLAAANQPNPDLVYYDSVPVVVEYLPMIASIGDVSGAVPL